MFDPELMPCSHGVEFSLKGMALVPNPCLWRYNRLVKRLSVQTVSAKWLNDT